MEFSATLARVLFSSKSTSVRRALPLDWIRDFALSAFAFLRAADRADARFARGLIW
jgi:hypothetical protein